MSVEELSRMLRELDEERFNLQVRRSLQPPDDPLQFRALRRQIARVKTVIHQVDGSAPKQGKKKKRKKK
jgi:ribosomal protein L29